MENKLPCENADIPIDIFENIQIDLKPEKPKKKRQVDDYDYNDPFLESFEGEFDVVELECKLENFFVYKGKIEEDPKRVARKYNKALKKHSLVDAVQESMKIGEETPAESIAKPAKRNSVTPSCVLEFENALVDSVTKHKKDVKFDNALMWILFTTIPSTKFKKYLREKVLSVYNPEKYGTGFEVQPEIESSVDDVNALKNEIAENFQKLRCVIPDPKNYTADMKTFENFKEEKLIQMMIDFVLNYVMYYTCFTERSIFKSRCIALDYICSLFNEKCTNKSKIKHYILRIVCLGIRDSDFSVSRVMEGDFVGEESTSSDSQPAEFTSSLTSAYSQSLKPSFDDSSILGLSVSDMKKSGKGMPGKPSKPYRNPTMPVFSSTFLVNPNHKSSTQHENNQTIVIENLNESVSLGAPSEPVGLSDTAYSNSLSNDQSVVENSRSSIEKAKDTKFSGDKLLFDLRNEAIQSENSETSKNLSITSTDLNTTGLTFSNTLADDKDMGETSPGNALSSTNIVRDDECKKNPATAVTFLDDSQENTADTFVHTENTVNPASAAIPMDSIQNNTSDASIALLPNNECTSTGHPSGGVQDSTVSKTITEQSANNKSKKPKTRNVATAPKQTVKREPKSRGKKTKLVVVEEPNNLTFNSEGGPSID